MTSSQHGPYAQGDTRATMDCTEGRKTAMWSQSLKQSSVRIGRLQPASVKSESLVTADQPCCSEYVPGPCTHRPSRHPSLLHPKSPFQPVREESAEGVAGKGDEVVTR